MTLRPSANARRPFSSNHAHDNTITATLLAARRVRQLDQRPRLVGRRRAHQHLRPNLPRTLGHLAFHHHLQYHQLDLLPRRQPIRYPQNERRHTHARRRCRVRRIGRADSRQVGFASWLAGFRRLLAVRRRHGRNRCRRIRDRQRLTQRHRHRQRHPLFRQCRQRHVRQRILLRRGHHGGYHRRQHGYLERQRKLRRRLQSFVRLPGRQQIRNDSDRPSLAHRHHRRHRQVQHRQRHHHRLVCLCRHRHLARYRHHHPECQHPARQRIDRHRLALHRQQHDLQHHWRRHARQPQPQ